MNFVKGQAAVFAAILFGVAVSPLSAGEAQATGATLSASKLAPLLGGKTEVEFVIFTKEGTVIIGGTEPYGSRAMSSEDVSQLSWDTKIAADWVEWKPASGEVASFARGMVPKAVLRKLGDRADRVLPSDWTAGNSGKALKKASRTELAEALKPKTFDLEVEAVSPDGRFAVVFNQESQDDELGELVYLRKDDKGQWRKLGTDQPAVSLSRSFFSPDSSKALVQYQSNGYDGPQPWALVRTAQGDDLLLKRAYRPTGATAETLPYCVAISSDGRLVAGWSDGSVTLRSLSEPSSK